MKLIFKFIFPIAFLAIVCSCGLDNFDAPESTLYGRIMYNGNALNLRGTGEAIRLQLYQDGYQKKDAIEVFVGQDGKFSAKLFNGEYKLVTRDGNGPWVNKRDTIIVNLKNSAEVNVEVTPYFLISNENISLSGSTMNTSFNIDQIVSTVELDKVILVLSKTQFADDVNNVFRKDFTGISAGPVNLSVDFSDSKDAMNARALYGRVGVYAKDIGQAIYSPVVKLK